MNDIATLISTLGFPIVVAVILAYVVSKMFDNYRADIAKMQDTHKAESEKFADALNKNTAVLQRLCDKLDADEGRDEV